MKPPSQTAQNGPGRTEAAQPIETTTRLVFLSKKELAHMLHISRVTLYKALKKNQIAWVDGRPVYTPLPIGRPRGKR